MSIYRSDLQIGLEEIIAPLRLADFAHNVWEKQTLHARIDQLRSETPLSVDEFERIISSLQSPRDSWLHFAKGEVFPLNPDLLDEHGMLKMRGVRSLFAGGYSIYLTKVERLNQVVGMIAGAIERDLADAGILLENGISAHAFLTPPREQGFSTHRDAHASLVWQLEGEKTWQVFNETRKTSPQGAKLAAGPVDDTELTNSKFIALQPGDALYVPAWWPHKAIAGDTTSLHVTFRLFPSLFPVPDKKYFRQRAQSNVRTVTALSEVGKLNFLSQESVLVRDPCNDLYVQEMENKAVLYFKGGELSGPVQFRTVFEFLARTCRFQVGELPLIESADYNALELVRRLVCEGVVEFEKL